MVEPAPPASAIVEAASDGIAWIDGGGTVRSWNSALTGLTGVDREHAVGQPWFVPLRLRDESGEEVLPGDGSEVAAAIGGRRGRQPLTFQVLHRDGRWRVLRATFAASDGTPSERGVVLVARDVTMEQELHDLEADSIATVSHELRTPLTPLRGFLTSLQHRRSDIDPEQLTPIRDAIAWQ